MLENHFLTSYIRFPSEARLHFQPCRDLERDVVVLEPGMLNQLRGAHPLLGVLDQQLGDEVLDVLRLLDVRCDSC